MSLAMELAVPDASSVGQDQELEVHHLVTSVSVQVVDRATCQQAVDLRTDIKHRQSKILEFFKPLKEAAYRAHKALTNRENEVLAPLAILDKRLQDAIQGWNDAQERLRREEERRLAELRRREQEEQAAREAAALEAAGHQDEAQAVMAEAIAAPMPVVVLPSVRSEVVGLKTRKDWRWRYVNNDPVKAFSRMPREFLIIDEKKIAAVVKAMKSETRIPGVEVFSVDVPVR